MLGHNLASRVAAKLRSTAEFQPRWELAAMPAVRDAQNEWVSKVLGVAMPSSSNRAGGVSRAWQAAVLQWRTAQDATDAQLGELARALLGTGDPELKSIAQFGLSAILADHRPRLMASIATIGDGTDATAFAQTGKKATALLRAFRRHLETDRRVGACDSNPFGVRVAIRATLAPALQQLQSVIETAVVAPAR